MADLDSDIDRLYQGPLDAFIDARNALAKASKVAAVKALVKPSLPAWAVNQLHWHQRALVDRLVAASQPAVEAPVLQARRWVRGARPARDRRAHRARAA